MIITFSSAITEDPVALYAAGLSTIIAIGTLLRITYQWVNSGPKAWVGILNPLEVSFGNNSALEIVIANTGTIPFVIKEISVTAHSNRRSQPFHTARFDHRTPHDPSMKAIPNPNGKPNFSVRVPHVIQQGDEAHHLMRPAPSYDPTSHWLRVQVTLRATKRPVVGWAAPINEAGADDPE